MEVLNFILNHLLKQPTIMIGLLVMVGYILLKKSTTKVLNGTFGAMVGMQLIIFGGSQFAAVFKPITDAVSAKFGIQGYIMDSYAMRATTNEALGEMLGMVGYVFLLAFAVNLAVVYFGKFTKAKGIFLTGNAGIAHATAILWLVVAYLGLGSTASVIISGILLGVYWAFSTTLAAGVTDKVTGGAGFTIGHNQQIGLWFFSKFSHWFGNPEKDDAENMKLPGVLNIFNNNITSVAIIMMIFVGAFMAPLGITGIQELAKDTHWINYIILIGINFSMYMVILLTGVRLLTGELTGAFKGIQERIVPNAVPAIDVAAILPFSPNAATLGFIFTTLGTVLSMVLLLVFKSPIMVIPGFIPLFFAGGPIGVVANKYGGYKAVIVTGIMLGLIQSFGTVWAIGLMKYPNGVGWSGMFDFATFWPFVTEILKFIGNLLGVA